MGWSDGFIAHLSAGTRSPVWALESIRLLGGGVGGDTDIASHLIGSPYNSKLKIGAVRTGGAQLNPLSWTATQGAFSVELYGDIGDVLIHYTRGTVVRLMLGFEGLSNFEPVALGMVKNIRGVSPRWTLEVWDLVQAMQTRITSTAGEAALFNGLGSQTYLTTAATVGTTDPLEVNSVSGFEFEAGGTGLVLVTPEDGQDPFYKAYTGIDTGANDFTPTLARNLLGTEQVIALASADSLVDEVAYIVDHPMDCLAKILTSTGDTNYNGAFDVLPPSWGYGIPQDLVDLDDLAQQRDALTSSGDLYEYAMVANEPQANGLAWIQSQLSGAGVFLVQRQGHITARFIQDPNGTAAEPTIDAGIEIRDSDIMAVSYEAWDSQQAAEYETWSLTCHGTLKRVATASSLVPTEEVQTLPVAGDYEAFAAVDEDGDDAADLLAEIGNRMAYWYFRVAERYTLTCAGLRLAQLCPGDLVTLSSSFLYGRSEAKRSAAALSGRRATVYAVSPDWIGGRVVVTLALLPDYAD